jgi:Domain of unknown function (DUF4384)
MSREEIHKLLGGYATDTLSEGERRALFEAALEDQELFDALAKEQALRDVLKYPLARQQLLDALGPGRVPGRTRAWQWLRQPAALALAGVVAMLLVVAGILLLRRTSAPPEFTLADLRTAPRKAFVPPPSRQQMRAQAVLPRPPILKPEYDMEKPSPPAVALLPPPPSAIAAARQLYLGPKAMGFATGALPQARAKMTRAGAAVPAVGNLGVEYSLMLKGADGEYAPARLDTEFHHTDLQPGDSVRLRLVPNDSGYVYLFLRDSTGGWRLTSTQRVARAQPTLLPTRGALQYDQPGRKELLVVLSTQEDPSLASLDTAELDALASSVSADILKATVSSGESGYAVDTRLRAGQQKVAFEITLEFR